MSNYLNSINRSYEIQLPYIYYMAATMCIGVKTYRKIKANFDSPYDFYMASSESLKKTGLFTSAQINRFVEAKRLIDPLKETEEMLKNGIKLVSLDERMYPDKLKEIKDPPPVLFYKGKLPKKGLPSAAVVGARECTPYGANVAKRLGEILAESDISVISGMARGIDSIAQTAAVSSGGYSCALLGGGVDIIYPKQSEDLYEKLCATGGIISEFPPKTAPLPKYFAMRNRLISGLSDVVCVVEAKEKSGTLITVDCALDQGREVYSVPGRITDKTSQGTNELIKQGAGVITDLSAFVEEFLTNYSVISEPEITKEKQESKTASIPELSENEKKLICGLDDDSFTVDFAANLLLLPVSDIVTACMTLCTKKMVSNIGAGRFRLLPEALKMKSRLTDL